MGELDSLRKKAENLKRFIIQVETENSKREFEENLLNCLNEEKKSFRDKSKRFRI